LFQRKKIRVQITGFKIAFVSTGLGLIAAYNDKIPIYVLVIPAITAIFFDYLTNSVSFSIKRIGFYIRKEIEPKLRVHIEWPKDSPMWEEFMCTPRARQVYGIIGNLGLTALAVAVAVVILLFPFVSARIDSISGFVSVALLIFMAIFFAIDIRTYRRVRNAFQDKIVWE
jgi:hypothetical protein